MSAELARLNRRLDERESVVRLWEQRYSGDSPLAFLSPEAKEALGNRLKALRVNYCKSVVDAITQRLRLVGFLRDGQPDPELWSRWVEAGGEDYLRKAITDALISGRGWLSVWGSAGEPTLAAEPPASVIVERDPLTRKPVLGLKRWIGEGKAHGLFVTLDRVKIIESKSGVMEGSSIPADGWNTVRELPNPLGVIPFFPLTNEGLSSEVHGVSEMAPIADLTDAVTKVLTDALVASEFGSQPRRWATGLQLVKVPVLDENGQPKFVDGELQTQTVDPFPKKGSKLWQAQSEGTKFGQFDPADLSGFSQLASTLLEQVSALSSLPSHYVFTKQEPSSSEEIRARESALIANAETKARMLSQDVGRAAAALLAVHENSDPRRIKVTPLWADPASRSQAAEADAVFKLASGDRPILPLRTAREKLRYTATEIQSMEQQDAKEAALRIASGL